MSAGLCRRRELTLACLQAHLDRPVPAIELAEVLAIPGEHETKRRRVRETIEALRGSGFAICAGRHEGAEGYWIARGDGEWSRYLEARKAQKVFDFVAIRKMRESTRDRISGQGRLFGEESG